MDIIENKYYHKDLKRIYEKAISENRRLIAYSYLSRDPFSTILYKPGEKWSERIEFVEPVHTVFKEFKRLSKNTFTIKVPYKAMNILSEDTLFTLSNLKGENWFQITSIEIIGIEETNESLSKYFSMTADRLITFKRLPIGGKLKRLKRRYCSENYLFLLNQHDHGYSNEEIFEFAEDYSPVSKRLKDLENEKILDLG